MHDIYLQNPSLLCLSDSNGLEAINCSTPIPPVNGFVQNVTLATATFGCNEGYTPQEIKTAFCIGADTWNPDPNFHNCSVQGILLGVIYLQNPSLLCLSDSNELEAINCSTPIPPVNGFVQNVTLATATFGCNEGYTPQEIETAFCIDINTWNPNPNVHTCSVQCIQRQSLLCSIDMM